MKTVELLTFEMKEAFPDRNWILRWDHKTKSYFANIADNFARLTYPTYAPTMTQALEACLARAKAGAEEARPNEVIRLEA